MKTTALAASIALTMSLGLALDAQAGALCANIQTGAINTRVKCARNETRLHLDNIAGMMKPDVQEVSGLDIAQCSTVSSTEGAMDGGVAVGAIKCAPGSYLLNYGYKTEPFALQAARSAEIQYSAGIPIGLIMSVSFDMAMVFDGLTKDYALVISGTCCPQA